MNDLGVAGTGGQHQSSLVEVVKGGGGLLVVEGNKDLADLEMPEAGGEMEVRVGESVGGVVGVVDEVGMVADDALDQRGIVAVHSAT